MNLLYIFTLLLTSTFANNTTSLFSRRSLVCQILPNVGTLIGEAPCGWGVVDTATGCECCDDGETTCASATQTCTPSAGGYVCVEKYSSGGSSCEDQGMEACGTKCMPIGQVCCDSDHYCLSSYECCMQADGSSGCCPLSATTSTTSAPQSTGSPISSKVLTIVSNSQRESTSTTTSGAGAKATSSGTSSNTASGPVATSASNRLGASSVFMVLFGSVLPFGARIASLM